MKTKIEIFKKKFTQTTWDDNGRFIKKEDFDIKQLSEAMEKLTEGDEEFLSQMRFCYKYFGTRLFEFNAL